MTKGQVQRLEQCFGILGQRAKSKPCLGMKGLVEEQQEIASEDRQESLLDAGLLGAARKVEHYEMAGYTNVISLAQQLGIRDCVQLLNETLREEVETERRLTRVAKQLIKEAAGMERQVETGGEEQRQSRRTARGKQSRASGQSRAGGRVSKSGTGGSRAQSGKGRRGGSAQPLVDHEQIRQWAEERGAQPACVRGTGRKKGEIGMIRLDFPGFSGEKSLQSISWDEWFEQFDANNLALVVQEQTSRGQKSNFNKLVSRENVNARREQPKVKRAGS